jgi:hypothetical protein
MSIADREGGDAVMSVAFYPGSARASGSDLSISVSPLGLVELADEEFEVHLEWH